MAELIPLFAIFFVIGVPVMSIAARFVLRPLLRDFAQALGRGRQPDEDAVMQLTHRMAQIETHLLEQDRRLNQLVDAELFRRQLEDRSGGVSQLGSGGSTPSSEGPGWSPPGH